MGWNPGGGERGTTTVECAIVLPLFLFLVVGVLEFSRFTANRSQIELALRRAGEYGGTMQGDCLTPARDRFFQTMSVLKSGSELTFAADVVPYTDDVQAVRIAVTGSEPTLLARSNIGVRVVGLFPIETPFGCSKRTSIRCTSSEWAASAELD